jgi:DNA-binding beta-propeller fold protein YncE
MPAPALCAALLFSAIPALAESTHEYSGVSFGPDGTSGTKFAHPGSVAVDQSTHDVYIADYGAGAVYKFNEKGEEAVFSALSSNKITGLDLIATESQIAVDSASHVIYVAGGEHSSLKAFKENGEPAEFSFLHSSEISGFEDLCGVAVDQNGDIYAGNFSKPDVVRV